MIEFLIFGLLSLSVICLWLLIEGRKKAGFLIWFIPLLLVLVTSTYITYTSILGLPKVEKPTTGLYLQHYIDEPNWIYLWVIEKDRIPRSYQFAYTRQIHDALEGVRNESDSGKYMILGDNEEAGFGNEGDDDNPAGGYSLGGDINFFEWNFENELPNKE